MRARTRRLICAAWDGCGGRQTGIPHSPTPTGAHTAILPPTHRPPPNASFCRRRRLPAFDIWCYRGSGIAYVYLPPSLLPHANLTLPDVSATAVQERSFFLLLQAGCGLCRPLPSPSIWPIYPLPPAIHRMPYPLPLVFNLRHLRTFR